MKVKSTLVAALVSLLVAGSSFAMMSQTGTVTGGTVTSGTMMGGTGGTVTGGTMMGAPVMTVTGYGMHGVGGMSTGMLTRTMHYGYLDVLKPVTTPQAAMTAAQGFITAAKSGLQISEVWEYQTMYKAELSDSKGQQEFDLMVDKLTGAVMPEMGFSMTMNANWGKTLQVTPTIGTKLALTPDAALAVARAFVSKNATVINYNLSTPETYPGYYKFHTLDTSGKPGMDIMVNGYNGHIWMNTQLGVPMSQVYQAP